VAIREGGNQCRDGSIRNGFRRREYGVRFVSGPRDRGLVNLNIRRNLIEAHDLIPAVPLGDVQALIGLIEHLLRISRPKRAPGDSDAGRDGKTRKLFFLDRLPESLTGLFGGSDIGVRQQYAELFSPKPTDKIANASRIAKDLTNAPQHLVAHRMTMVVVNRLKEIDVDHDAAQRMIMPLGRPPQGVKLLEE